MTGPNWHDPPPVEPPPEPLEAKLDRIAASLDRIAAAVERNAHGVETANLYAVYSNSDLQYRLSPGALHRIEDAIILRTLENDPNEG